MHLNTLITLQKIFGRNKTYLPPSVGHVAYMFRLITYKSQWVLSKPSQVLRLSIAAIARWVCQAAFTDDMIYRL